MTDRGESTEHGEPARSVTGGGEVSRGVIYIAVGETFVREACISARSVRRHMPDLSIAIFSDVHVDSELFDSVTQISHEVGRAHREKLVWMPRTPYDETLYLDTDTYLVDAVDELFDLLDRFDMALTHDRGYQDDFPVEGGVPVSYRELNTGVVVFRKSEPVRALFASALRWYDRLADGRGFDQQAFRIAAYHSPVPIAPLTYEYNCRFSNINMVSGLVKVLHCRPHWGAYDENALEAIARKLNASSVPRVFVCGRLFLLLRNRPGLLPPYAAVRASDLFENRCLYLVRRFVSLARRDGLISACHKLLDKLSGQFRRTSSAS